ncbi:hypothetical protein KRX19_01155 [Cardiobacteriaceae bacterium TAE3-ERU3]|nr:hypothetical protein [Cardiobacteriaceae bacterium TAE3-ERU3]
MRRPINPRGILSAAILAAVLLGGCAIQPKLRPSAQPTPQLLRWQVNEVTPDGAPGAPTMVVAAPDGGDWRWLWTDALGMPLARKMLHDGTWQKDGLLPANKAALPLFNALAALSLDGQARQQVFPALQILPSSEDAEAVTFVLVAQKGSAQEEVYPQFSYDCSSGDQEQQPPKNVDKVDWQQCSDATLNLYPMQSRYQIRILD